MKSLHKYSIQSPLNYYYLPQENIFAREVSDPLHDSSTFSSSLPAGTFHVLDDNRSPNIILYVQGITIKHCIS